MRKYEVLSLSDDLPKAVAEQRAAGIAIRSAALRAGRSKSHTPAARAKAVATRAVTLAKSNSEKLKKMRKLGRLIAELGIAV